MMHVNLFRGRAANGQAGVGAGYDCEIRRESESSVIVNVTAVGSDGDYLERMDVQLGADLDALARRIANSPFEYVEANLPDAEWNALAEAWNKLGDKLEAAEDWYNSTPKAELIAWATAQGVDIGQDGDELAPDWNEKIIDAYVRR